jgi:hypothetical protein
VLPESPLAPLGGGVVGPPGAFASVGGASGLVTEVDGRTVCEQAIDAPASHRAALSLRMVVLLGSASVQSACAARRADAPRS